MTLASSSSRGSGVASITSVVTRCDVRVVPQGVDDVVDKFEKLARKSKLTGIVELNAVRFIVVDVRAGVVTSSVCSVATYPGCN